MDNILGENDKNKKSGSPERLFSYLQLLTYEKKLLLL